MLQLPSSNVFRRVINGTHLGLRIIDVNFNELRDTLQDCGTRERISPWVRPRESRPTKLRFLDAAIVPSGILCWFQSAPLLKRHAGNGRDTDGAQPYRCGAIKRVGVVCDLLAGQG